jgi:hypothetical protein
MYINSTNSTKISPPASLDPVQVFYLFLICICFYIAVLMIEIMQQDTTTKTTDL